MPPRQTSIREVPDRAFACRSARRRIKKKNLRNLVELLLVTSELGAAAVAELADQELQRVRAARADIPDLGTADHFTDGARAGEIEISPICTQPDIASDGAAPAPAAEFPGTSLELARETLQESREQSAVVRRLLSRAAEQTSRLLPPPPDPALIPAAAPSPAGGAVVAAPRDLAGLLLPDGTSVAQALAARDARIAQLRFEISDRDRRQRIASIDRAAAFVRDPANQLAASPLRLAPPPPGREPTQLRGASSSALPGARCPLLLPQVPRRARAHPPSGPRADSAQCVPAEPPCAAPAPPPPPEL